ncbi:MAG: ATPase P [bacterium]|nr:ATPase P [bacterium]
MIEIDIPGHKTLRLEHLVLDYNGTLAVDGEPINGVRDRLEHLAQNLRVHVITADTFGKVSDRLSGLPCKISILPLENQAQGKLNYIQQLGPDTTVCIGNGRNDRLMLQSAALGIAVVQNEGASSETLSASNVVCTNICSALDLLTNPLRLVATLRS